MAQVARKHHFVPASYLAGFTDNGTKKGNFYGYDLKSRTSFPAKPIDVAHDRDFNRFEAEGQAPDALEIAYGQFEGKAALAVRNICRTNDLTQDEDYHYLLNLIALLAIRNPALRRSMRTARESLLREIGYVLTSDKKLSEHHLQSAIQNGYVSRTNVPFEQMREFVKSSNYSIKVSRESLISMEVEAFDSILQKVGERSWCLLIAAPDAPDFITCDHPVSLPYKQAIFPPRCKACSFRRP